MACEFTTHGRLLLRTVTDLNNDGIIIDCYSLFPLWSDPLLISYIQRRLVEEGTLYYCM